MRSSLISSDNDTRFMLLSVYAQMSTMCHLVEHPSFQALCLAAQPTPKMLSEPSFIRHPSLALSPLSSTQSKQPHLPLSTHLPLGF
jgi:hypothetical protein